MEEKGSSIKNLDFSGMTDEQIIEKYENVLVARENQLEELSSKVGKMNETLLLYSEKYNSLEENNKELKNKLSKKEEQLNIELNSKEIMFLQLEKKESEYEELKKEIDELIELSKKNNIELPDDILKDENEEKEKETINQIENFATAAKDKIKNLTSIAGDNIKNLTSKAGDNLKKFKLFDFFTKSSG